MYCGKCGAWNPDGNYYCIKCGADLSQMITPKNYRLNPKLAETVSYFKPQMVIGERYKILRELGRGGRGVVYKALDLELSLTVAIKFLPQELVNNQEAIEDLKKEAKASMLLTHPNIVRLYNFEDQGKYKFLIMEYIDGYTLEQSLRRRKKFTLTETIEYAKQICAGLGYAHNRGVIHRDIKPSNIMKTHEGVIKITDFGIAANIDDCLKRITHTKVIGTPLYMSPEQLLGEPTDQRSDIYSLGVVLYEFLTGQPPFPGGDVRSRILGEEPAPIPDVPERINEAILKALKKNKEERWNSASELAQALEGKPRTVRLPTVEKERTTSIFERIKRKLTGKKEEKGIPHLRARRFDLLGWVKNALLLLWGVGFGFFLFKTHPSLSPMSQLAFGISLVAQSFLIGIISDSVPISAISVFALSFIPFFGYWKGGKPLLFPRGGYLPFLFSGVNTLSAVITTDFKLIKPTTSRALSSLRDLFIFWAAFAIGLVVLPLIEENGIRFEEGVVFFALALIFGFIARRFFIPPLATATVILCWGVWGIGFSYLLANFRELSSSVKIFFTLMPLSTFYTKLWEFPLLALGVYLLRRGIFTLAGYTRSGFAKAILGIFAVLLITAIALFLFLFIIFPDTGRGEMVLVPAGSFFMGTNLSDISQSHLSHKWDAEWFKNEQPQHKVFVDSFYIDKFEVTNRDYFKFLKETGYPPPPNWEKGRYPLGTGRHPVCDITLEDAKAYAKWAGKRLPTEEEWEKAARGEDKREFPWGNKDISISLFHLFTIYRCAYGEKEVGSTSAVGSHILGKSPYGTFDMAGNVAEWVDSPYRPYPGNRHKDVDYKKGFYVIRGGGWMSNPFFFRTPARAGMKPKQRSWEIGFRCVKPAN